MRALYAVEPWAEPRSDLQMAQLAAASVAPWSKTEITPAHFLPDWWGKKRRRRRRKPEELRAYLVGLTRSWGGEVVSGGNDNRQPGSDAEGG